MRTPSRTDLPEGFLWGAATASYQIEGAHDEDGRLPSIWDTFAKTPGRVLGGDTGDQACDHYHRWEQDLDLAAELGVGAYRFSIAWPRIIPTGTGPTNQRGIDFYSRLVDGLLARGIRPVATLYHWDLPQSLDERSGWLNRDSAEWFGEYAAAITAALGDRVQHWTTLNEPWCSSVLSYAIGAHAPGHQDPLEALVAAHHLLLAHGTAVPIIREHSPGAQVSITLNPTQVWGPQGTSTQGLDELDLDAIRRADNVFNGLFFGPLFHGGLPEGMAADTAHLTDHAYIHPGDFEVIAAPLDNLGVNNYFPTRVRAARVQDAESSGPSVLPGCDGVLTADPHPPLTAMGWECSPEGHRQILARSAAESGLPIYITENGSAWDDVVTAQGRIHDAERTAYLRSHLDAVSQAIADGVDVRGYFAWSLLDNFEWAFGYSKRFGLVHVDYATQERRLKDSALAYQQIIRG